MDWPHLSHDVGMTCLCSPSCAFLQRLHLDFFSFLHEDDDFFSFLYDFLQQQQLHPRERSSFSGQLVSLFTEQSE